MTRRYALPFLAAALCFSMGGMLPLAAQQASSSSAVTVTPRKRGVLAVDPGNTISAVFLAKNGSTAALKVIPRVVAPTDWSVVTGVLPFTLGVGESDTWVISLAVPAHAARGQYVIPVSATIDDDQPLAVRDSVIVEVKERHDVTVVPLDHPAFAVAGDAYHLSFLVRNGGNGPARVRLLARSSRGATVTLDAAELTLSADSSRAVGVHVPTRSVDAEAADDVLEMQVMEEADTSSQATASARVTIVPKPGASNPFVTVPGQLLLRAAGPGAGVAPFELTGAGRLRPDGSEQAEFLFRGPTDPWSPFGEREEYRIGISAPNYKVRVGDNYFGFSPLTNLGLEGFGGGGELTRTAGSGALTVGAYSERFRFQPDNVGETGGSLSLRAPAVGFLSARQLSVSAVDRTGGPLAGQIVSSGVSLQPWSIGRVEAELAASRSASGPGSATSLRLSNGDLGEASAVPLQYDVMHMTGSDSFAGAVRGATHDYATVSTQTWRDFQLNGSASSHESTVLDMKYRLRTARFALTHAGDASLSYIYAQQDNGSSAFRDSLLIASMPGAPADGFSGNGASALRTALTAGDATQRGVAANVQHTFGADRLWAATELGATHQLASGLDRGYHALELGSSVLVGPHSLGFYAERYDGGSITRGPTPLTMLGGNAGIQLARATKLTMFGSASVQRSGGHGFSQLDAHVTQTLPTGATVGVRARLTMGQWDPRANERIVFLESSFPLHVPVGLESAPGRVRGRIVSGETGLGVSGALVRLGSQAAITDADGRVSFAGLPAGEYRVSLAQDMSMTGSAVDGDPTVRIDGTRRDPATFKLAVARAGIVRGTVHHWEFAKTAIGNEPDSVVDGGPMRGVVVSLISDRDTLYRTTDETGAFQFPERSPKHWTLKVVSDAPARSRFEPQVTDVGLTPGGVFEANVRLLPVRRKVRIIDESDRPLLPQAVQDSTRGGPGRTHDLPRRSE